MKPKSYQTSVAFRRVLEDRLKTQSRAEGLDLQRLRRSVAFDRLLCRLFASPNAPWILKGGYAMELRIGSASERPYLNELPKIFDGGIVPGMSPRRTTRKQREHWLAQFDQSNLTAAAFCREHQLSCQNFPNWRRKSQPKEADTPTAFIEVEVPTSRATSISHSNVVELIFPSGLLLRIHPQPAARS